MYILCIYVIYINIDNIFILQYNDNILHIPNSYISIDQYYPSMHCHIAHGLSHFLHILLSQWLADISLPQSLNPLSS